MSTHLDSLMKEFAQFADLPTLEPDVDGGYYLMFDDLVVIVRLAEPIHGGQRLEEEVLLHSCVGMLPSANREQACRRLLDANILFAKTDGATLAADEEAGLVSLQRAIPLRGLAFSEFIKLLESFVHQTEFWAQVCSADLGESVATSDAGENLPLSHRV